MACNLDINIILKYTHVEIRIHLFVEKNMDLDQNAELLKDLGQCTRLKVLQLLLEGEKNVSELQEKIEDVPQGRLSTHLT